MRPGHCAAPEIFLGSAACAILMLDLLLTDAQRRWTGVLAVSSLLVTAVLVGATAGIGPGRRARRLV